MDIPNEYRVKSPQQNTGKQNLKTYKKDYIFMTFPGGSAVKNLPASAGDSGSIPGMGSPWRRK